MITGKKEELEQYCKKLKCPEHPDKDLTVAWHQTEGYVIRCGAGHFPEELVEELPPTRLAKQGKIEPAGDWFNLTPKTDLGTGELLDKKKIEALVDYALKYGLDPYRGHVMLMYGQPYIGLDGYIFHAERSGEPYQLESHPLSPEERNAYQINEGDHAWLATVRKPKTGGYWAGIGVVTRHELEEEAKGKPGVKRYPVVAAHPWQLAQKRAEWQGMRRAFPIGKTEEVKSET